MAENKKAKYYCESCGAEVPANAKFCRKCGKFFSAVRCPKCGKVGSVRDFKTGCPRCHYAMSDSEIYGTDEGEGTLDGEKHRLSRKSKKAIKKAFKKHESHLDENVPTWLLVASLIVLAVVFILVIKRCS